MPHDRLQCSPDPDGSFVITHTPETEATSPPPVVARVYDPAYARMMTKSPELLGMLQWVRTLLSKEACQCQPGVRECVVCLTDDLLTELAPETGP
jgi:hypothetical protein